MPIKTINENLPYQIAIDGPAGAGKGTVARAVAEKLGYLYFETGALYRCIALLSLKHKISPDDENKLLEILKKHTIEIRKPTDQESQDNRHITVLINGQDVSWKIRHEDISLQASKLSHHPKIRNELKKHQQEVASKNNIVMEGRDVTNEVLPNAQTKIFLHAHPHIRAQRRFKQLIEKGHNTTYEKVLEDLIERDKRDHDRLSQMPKDTWVIDASNQNIETIVHNICESVKQNS